MFIKGKMRRRGRKRRRIYAWYGGHWTKKEKDEKGQTGENRRIGEK